MTQTKKILVELKLIVLTSRSSLVKHPITSADSLSFHNHKGKHQRQNANTDAQTIVMAANKCFLTIKSDNDGEESVQITDPDRYFQHRKINTQTHNDDDYDDEESVRLNFRHSDKLSDDDEDSVQITYMQIYISNT